MVIVDSHPQGCLLAEIEPDTYLRDMEGDL